MSTEAGAVGQAPTRTEQLPRPLTLSWARSRTVRLAALALLVFVVGIQQNFARITENEFHPDESRWLNRAFYLKELRHPLSSAWEERYLTRGQPPGGSYVTALGLLAQGRDLETNGPWDFVYGSEVTTWWNISRGNMPAWADLEAGRRTSAVLGALSAVLAFLIVGRLTNLVGATIAGLFFAFHPLSVHLSTLAVSDAAFTTIVALTTLAAMTFAARPNWRRTVAFGLMLGLGAATKLSPLFLAVGFAAIGVGFVLVAPARQYRPTRWLVERIPGLTGAGVAPMGWKLLTLPAIAFGFFVASYPYLWPAPLQRTDAMLDFRAFELANQARLWPAFAIESRGEALERTWWMLGDTYSTSGELVFKVVPWFDRSTSGRGIDMPFALAGLAIFAWLAWRSGATSPAFFALVASGGQTALILAKMRIDFDRYYLPVVLLCALGVGVLTGMAWEWATRLARGRERGRASRATNAAALNLPETSPSTAD